MEHERIGEDKEATDVLMAEADEDTSSSEKTEQMPMRERCCLIVLGLCVGDCLGATSEFEIPWDVAKHCVEKYAGWPGKLVGGGKKDKWKIGEPTDDSSQAIDIVRSYFSLKKLEAKDIAKRFLQWYNGRPKGIGNTTALVLSVLRNCPDLEGGKWLEGSKRAHKKNPENAANGR